MSLTGRRGPARHGTTQRSNRITGDRGRQEGSPAKQVSLE